MRRYRTLGRYVMSLCWAAVPGVLRLSVSVTCFVTAACVFGSSSPSPLRGYRLVIEGRDSLSNELAVALAGRGFTVRRRIQGGSPASAALVTFTYRDVGPSPTTWLNALLADTRSGSIVAAVSVPLDSLGPTRQIRARSLAESLAARLAQAPTPP